MLEIDLSNKYSNKKSFVRNIGCERSVLSTKPTSFQNYMEFICNSAFLSYKIDFILRLHRCQNQQLHDYPNYQCPRMLSLQLVTVAQESTPKLETAIYLPWPGQGTQQSFGCWSL